MKFNPLKLVLWLAVIGVAVWLYVGLVKPVPNAAPAAPASVASDAPKPAPKPAAGTGIAPPKAEAPVVKQADAAATAAKPAQQKPAEDYQPQADLNGCIAQTIKLLNDKDVLSLVKTLLPQDQLQSMIANGQVSSVEDVAAQYTQMPDINTRISLLEQAMETIKDAKPDMSADGTRAVYKLDPSVVPPNGPGSGGNITFYNVNGYWYLRN